MNSVNPSRVFSSLLSGFSALLALGLAAPLPTHAAPAPPAGDLTVTVYELKNGGVKFTVSGTAYMQDDYYFGDMNVTNFSDADPGTPPANGEFEAFLLPEGLKLTVPNNIGVEEVEENDAPLDAPGSTVDISLSAVLVLYERWFLGDFNESFSSGPLYTGDPIIGSGSVTANDVPFSIFVPGTYLVRPGCGCGGPEASVSEGESEGEPKDVGLFPYFITYKVIPYSEGLTVEKPKRFKTTKVGRSSKTQILTITNEGGLPLTGLKVSISNANAKNFKITQPVATTLDAGASTVFTATFEPGKEGQCTAAVTVTDGNLRQKITLKGKGDDNRVVGSPRFPRGPK